MKELYTSPELEMFALIAEEKLAAYDVEFNDMLASSSSGGGVSEDPNVDIDVPIIKP